MAARLAAAPAVLVPGAVPLPLIAADVFGRRCPLELEIGVGKGLFLLAWAADHPEIGLLGVERTAKYLRMAAVRVARRNLPNVRLVQSTAEDVLFRCLGPATVAAVHVYFPDPWPKKRHHKRRFFSDGNVRRLAEVLVAGGLLRVKTDHEEYASVISAALAAEAALEEADVDAAFDGVPPTSYELKYARDRRPVRRFAFKRRGANTARADARQRRAGPGDAT